MERPVNPIERSTYRVLVVDPEPAVRQMLADLLSPVCRVALASTGREARDQLERRSTDLLLMDGCIGSHRDCDDIGPFDYRELIKWAREQRPLLPAIVLSPGESSRRDRNGVSFLSKQLLTSEVGRSQILLHVDRLVDGSNNQRAQSYESHRRWRAAEEGANFVIGPSESSARLREQIDRGSAGELNILLTGETGVGKTLVAENIHQRWSAGEQRPFVIVEPAALPPSLFESELFGHVRGAFTDACAVQQGAFEAAHRGTILLDEIAELPLELQVKLLRAVERGVIRRVGSTCDINLQVRVIAASNRDIEQEVERGRFRADLFQRLNELRLHIPPLRERREDILVLFEHFLGLCAPSRHLPGGIDQAVADCLLHYHWPGNVRELLTLARRLAQPGLPTRLILDAVTPFFYERRSRLADDASTLDARIKEYSRGVYLQALAMHSYRLRDAARTLAIPYGTLRSRLRSLDLIGLVGEKRQQQVRELE